VLKTSCAFLEVPNGMFCILEVLHGIFCIFGWNNMAVYANYEFVANTTKGEEEGGEGVVSIG
jgi:hypothetical protein